MSVTRRRFIAGGVAAAVVGAVPTAGAARAFASPATLPVQRRSRGDLFASSDNFRPHVGSSFAIAGPGARSLRLTDVADFRMPTERSATADGPSGAGFVLTFDASRARGLDQGTYTLSHRRLGTFALFVAPAGTGRAIAVINRLR